jgi:hypothetical protein
MSDPVKQSSGERLIVEYLCDKKLQPRLLSEMNSQMPPNPFWVSLSGRALPVTVLCEAPETMW